MYYVLGTPGQKYGPADLATLRQWVAEGRLASGSMLEDAATGQTFAAQSLPGLFDAPQGPPVVGQPYSPVQPPASAVQQPYSPVSNPGGQQPYSPVSNPGTVHSANIDPNTGHPFQSPYVRYDAKRDFSRNNSVAQAALVLIIVSYVCCFSMSFWAIGASVAAVICSLQAKNAGHEKGQLYVVLASVAVGLNIVIFILGFFFDPSSLIQGTN